MIVLDTTVLVYAVGDSGHPLAGPARSVVDAVMRGTVRATTTIEVVQEFAHVRARRRPRADAARLASRYATLLAPLIAPGREELLTGLDLFALAPDLGAFDAVLAATVRARDPAALVSGDGSFARVEGLRFLPLEGAEVASLTGGGISRPV